jgi:tripartite-type tricarboxylate transporter receptor subunit TctC
VTDLVAGRVHFGIPTMPAALPFVRDGRLKALAISTAKRAAALPEVPSLLEAGIADYDTALWTGLLAPARTPSAILSRLRSELQVVLSAPDVREALARQGAEPSFMPPEQFAAFIATELARWARVVKAANITP